MTDEELLTEYLKTKNNDLFDLFDQRMRPRIFKLALKLLASNHAAADDITQEVLVKLMLMDPIDLYPPVSDFVFAITRNLCKNYCRAESSGIRRNMEPISKYEREERRHGSNSDFAGLFIPEDDESDTERQIRELNKSDPGYLRAKEALKNLPEEWREAIRLCFCENKTHQEAAKVLHLKRSTLRSYIHKGMKLLREAKGVQQYATA